MTDGQARAALGRFLPDAEVEQVLPLGNAGGFSGASLWRVRSRLGLWCLRAWPVAGPDVERLQFIHHLQERASVLPFVPRLARSDRGTTWLDQGERLWELAAWMPGVADYHARPAPARLRSACRALAQLHDVWHAHQAQGLQPLGFQRYPTREPLEVCPAVLRRLQAYNDCRAHLPSCHVPEGHPLAAARRALYGHIDTIPALLRPWLASRLPVQPCLCDCWHDHWLFAGDEVTGLIDYGAAKLDHVAVDVARLLGSLAVDDEAAWATGLAAYREVRMLNPDEEALTHVLDRTGCVLAVWTWVRRLLIEGRRYPDTAAVAERLGGLLGRLDR